MPSNVWFVLYAGTVTHDAHTVRMPYAAQMFISGIGKYTGPEGIGEYRTVPMFVYRTGNSRTTAVHSLPARTLLSIDFLMQEEWPHLAGTNEAAMLVPWNIEYKNYPCSVIRKEELTQFPVFMAKAFSDSARWPSIGSVVTSMCTKILANCNGTHAQYNSSQECEAYLLSLPHHNQACQSKWGAYTAMGESLMCKYLHHFMISFSPHLHCYHAGQLGMPDANGNTKCTAADCLPTVPGVPTARACTPEDAEQLTEATLYALEYCLPTLASGRCSANCSQAVNTFLGRFVENGAVCACYNNGVGLLGVSHILDEIQVDFTILLKVCQGSQLLFPYPVCMGGFISGYDLVTCEDPTQYLARGGCRNWDWNELEASVYHQWTEMRQGYRRITQSQAVAAAECNFFSKAISLHLNIHPNDIPMRAAAL
eukprot:5538957-Prymnesium_polylepis.1